ncbi:YdcH family protein [Sphingomonas ginkgonis]|nr:YdcH family protein [Sphingomonas ginkgonis]
MIRLATKGAIRGLLSGIVTLQGRTDPMEKPQADALANKHAALHAMIDAEEHRRHPDDELLNRLKREKLMIKDHMLGIAPN